MTKLRSARRLAQKFRRARRDQKGGVAPMFAVLAGVLVMVTGVGMDISRVVGARTQLQDATDAAGLALGRMPANSDVNTVLVPAAKQWVSANLHGTAIDPDAVTVGVTPQDNGVRITASTTVQPTLAAIVHLGPFAVSSGSTIKYDITKVEVALVLDNTYSMSVPLDGSKSKIQVLKEAASNLVDTLMTPANTGGVKMGVVPYGEYVNVGVGNRTATWLSGVQPDSQASYQKTAATPAQPATDPYWVPASCSTVTPSSTQCTGGVKGTCYNYQDGVATSSYSCWTTPQTCTTTYGTPYQQCTAGYMHAGTPAKPATPATYGIKYTKWFGCVKHIVKSGLLADPDPPSTMTYGALMESYNDVPNFNSKYCLSPILPLSGDNTTVKNAINGLVVSQGPYPNYYPETYVPGGLHWGVNVLSPIAPFTEGAAYDPKNVVPRKALILMTDGNNTRYLKSDGTVGANANAQTYSDQARMCQDAKDKAVEVYTVGFGVGDATQLAALKSCATDSSHYFDAQSSADLMKAFQVIAGSLTKLRVAH